MTGQPAFQFIRECSLFIRAELEPAGGRRHKIQPELGVALLFIFQSLKTKNKKAKIIFNSGGQREKIIKKKYSQPLGWLATLTIMYLSFILLAHFLKISKI